MKKYFKPIVKIVEVENEALLFDGSSANNEMGSGIQKSKKLFGADYMDEDEKFDSFE